MPTAGSLNVKACRILPRVCSQQNNLEAKVISKRDGFFLFAKEGRKIDFVAAHQEQAQGLHDAKPEPESTGMKMNL